MTNSKTNTEDDPRSTHYGTVDRSFEGGSEPIIPIENYSGKEFCNFVG